MVVDGLVVVEVKCVEKLAPIHLPDLGEDGLRGCRDVSSNASLLRGLCVLCGERLLTVNQAAN